MPDNLLDSFQQGAKDAALDIISNSPNTTTQLQQIFQQHFPNQSLSVVAKAFAEKAEDDITKNDTCSAAVDAALEAADGVLDCMATIDQYIQLTVPKMEDGGNFGVGVQLAAIKVITDQSEKINKAVENLGQYYASRADALEKCKLPSTSKTSSKTVTSSESTGKDAEKGDTSNTSNGTSSEEKTTETSSSIAELALRKQAVTAVDLKYYKIAKATFQASITAFLCTADFADKNKVKIEKPKGDSGSRGYSSSMY